VNATATTTADITARGITGRITADNKVYDATGTATILTRTLTGVLGTDAVSYSGGAALFSDKNVGTDKTVTGSGLGLSGADAGNYTVNATATTQADITPAPLDIAANSATRLYGDANPAFNAIYTGFQTGESAATLTGALAFATPAVPSSNVGNYAIIPSGQSSTNYTISYVSGTLGVTPAPLMVTADAKSKLFGTIDPPLTFGVAGLVNNPALGVVDTAGSVLSGALTRVPGESALGGPYAITQGSLAANSNYNIAFTGGNLIITGAAAEPVLGFNAGQVIFAGVINNEFYYRPGNFWHISLNPNNADPGFDVMRGTSDLRSRLGERLNRCDSVSGGGFCETWSFPQQSDKVDKR
ncbi:MAG: MBG domain-containing protein, partial [Phycisphaeraceae bacterium]